MTVHAAIGAEIIHQHPAADGAAIGATSHRDFRRLAGSLAALDHGGAVLNLGSAVVLPEVFLKALAVARNLEAADPPNSSQPTSTCSGTTGLGSTWSSGRPGRAARDICSRATTKS